MSTYSTKKNITYKPMNNKQINNLSLLNNFILSFNKWIAIISENAGFINHEIPKSKPLEQRVQPIIPFIKLNYWIVLSDMEKNKIPKVIGFENNNLTFYIEHISIKDALKFKNAPIKIRRNDPFLVNNLLYSFSERDIKFSKKDTRIKSEIYDKRSKEINKSLYKHFLYRLFLLEFINVFNTQKNNVLRKKIKKLLMKLEFDIKNKKSKITSNNYENIYVELKNLIENEEDFKKINIFISDYLNNHHDKLKLFEKINFTKFNFDIYILQNLKNKNKEYIKKELYKISKKIITINDSISLRSSKDTKSSTNLEFENFLTICSEKSTKNYCKNNKLIVPKNKLDKYIDILASDILNPFKSKWVLSSIFTEKVINYLKFIKRPYETIVISY